MAAPVPQTVQADRAGKLQRQHLVITTSVAFLSSSGFRDIGGRSASWRGSDIVALMSPGGEISCDTSLVSPTTLPGRAEP
jgi:hypothetical protein